LQVDKSVPPCAGWRYPAVGRPTRAVVAARTAMVACMARANRARGRARVPGPSVLVVNIARASVSACSVD
jgi:hypothetical protein